MRAVVVVEMQPLIQIGLQRVDAVIELLAERNLVELLQDRLVEPLADAVGLGRLHLGFRVINMGKILVGGKIVSQGLSRGLVCLSVCR